MGIVYEAYFIEEINILFYSINDRYIYIKPYSEEIEMLVNDGEIEQDCINFNYKNMIMINCN
jgi:hypothetical protein